MRLLTRLAIFCRRFSIALALLAPFVPGSSVEAADLRRLQALFSDRYASHYEPRFCGRNVAGLIQAAHARGINLDGAYVLKIVGAGFFETSGFYTRGTPDERAMLGYFHIVLVAERQVFDFDLHEPLVLPIESYVRLQFAAPGEPTQVFGVAYSARRELEAWTATRFEVNAYRQGLERSDWNGPLREWVDLDAAFSRARAR